MDQSIEGARLYGPTRLMPGSEFFNREGNDIAPQLDVLDGIVALELGYIDDVTPGTIAASKAIIVDANKDAAAARNLTSINVLCGVNGVGGSAGTLVVRDGANPGSEINFGFTDAQQVDGITAGVCAASKAIVLSAYGVADFKGITPGYGAYSTAGTGGRNKPFIAIGSWDDPMNIILASDHWVPIQVNLKNTGNAAYDVAAIRARVDTGGATPTANHNCVELRQSIGHNVAQSSIVQASVSIDGAVTVGTGSILGGYFAFQGTGAITKAGDNDCTPLVAVNNNTGGGVDNVFIAMQNGTGTTVDEIVKVVCEHGTAAVGVDIQKSATGTALTTGLRIGAGATAGIQVCQGAATPAVALRLGATATEGLEIKVYDETITLTNAASTDTTCAVPAGAVILSVQGNLQATVTGDASGDDALAKIGLGITSDENKFCVFGALTKNTKADAIPDWAVSSGETVAIFGLKSDGSTPATEKFTGGAGQTVRVRVVYAVTNSLDDA